MNTTAYHILRVGLGATFIVIGFSVWLAPEAWGGFIQPWARQLLPGELVQFMKSTALVDLALGIWFLLNRAVWVAAGVASLHVLSILVTTTAMGAIIERDIALFAAALALFVASIPDKIKRKFGK